MLSKITTLSVAGQPLFILLGITALLLFVAAALIPTLNQRAIWNVPMKWHFRLAKTAIVLAVLHALIASGLIK